MQITRYDLDSKLNIKLAIIADTHGKVIDKVYESLKKEKPDYILIPGDFFDRHKLSDENKRENFVLSMLSELEKLSKFSKIYMSLGNHEFSLTDDEKNRIKEKVNLLDNEYVIENDIAFGGLTSTIERGYKTRNSENPDLDFIDDFTKLDKYKILLCHHPEHFNKFLKEEDIDLVISGHAHGGQIRIFGKGIFAPGQGLFPKYTSGKHDNLIISKGLANTAKIPRAFNPLELIYINI